jgi:hypothetical protein
MAGGETVRIGRVGGGRATGIETFSCGFSMSCERPALRKLCTGESWHPFDGVGSDRRQASYRARPARCSPTPPCAAASPSETYAVLCCRGSTARWSLADSGRAGTAHVAVPASAAVGVTERCKALVDHVFRKFGRDLQVPLRHQQQMVRSHLVAVLRALDLAQHADRLILATRRLM